MGKIKALFSVSLLFVGIGSCVAPKTQPPVISQSEIMAEEDIQFEYVDRVKSKPRDESEKYSTSRERFEDEQRFRDIGARILKANMRFCGDRIGPTFGFQTWSYEDRSREKRSLTRRIFGSGKGLVVAFVQDIGPAQTYGLQPGDKVISINGKAVSKGRSAKKSFEKSLRRAAKDGTVTLGISRNGEKQALRIPTTNQCDYPLIVNEKKDINAYTDGRGIYINRGMLDFFETNEELAYILGHELAHATEGHLGARGVNSMGGALVGAIFDVLFGMAGVNTGGEFSKLGANIAALSFSPEYEEESDYVGMYYASRAGFHMTEEVGDLWRRMAVDNPKKITATSTHPTTSKRFLTIRKTVAEINAKRASGQPLAPNLKEDQEKGADAAEGAVAGS